MSQTANKIPLVAIVGNPNAGKTTLFNSLTGSHQKVGNYPGVTVEKVSSNLKLESVSVECVDVPGLYSLNPVSHDEQVAVDVIHGVGYGAKKPDLLVFVLSAANLERNLFFFSQLAETEFPMVVALTMSDMMEQKGVKVDIGKLSSLLGVQVVPVVGHRGKGVAALKQVIEENLEEPRRPVSEFGFPISLETKVAALRERFARSGIDASAAKIRSSILNRDVEFEESVRDIPDLHSIYQEALEEVSAEGLHSSSEVATRYQWAAMVERAVLPLPEKGSRVGRITDRLDYVFTHRVFGLIIFLAVMYLVFQSIYTFAQPLMDVMTLAFDKFGGFVGSHLEGAPILQSLVVDGLIGGVGTMLTFLPQILILFFFIAVLEGTGYLARSAFLMDRLLGWCGLNGRAFIPLLSSFACAIPGIMSARVMPDSKSRLATILVAPLMSCSARLPVYLLLIGAFIQPRFGKGWAGFTLFAMHLLGLLVAIPIVFILNKGVIKGKRLPFLLELPPYQWPKWRDVWLAMYFRGKVFVNTAGTIIVLMSIIIWALSFFPRSHEAAVRYETAYRQEHAGQTIVPGEVEKYVEEQQLAHSYLGTFGRTIQPVFEPAGFDWRITTAILAAFPARETVVSSLGILFSLGKGDDSAETLPKALQTARQPNGKPLLTGWTAAGLMVFFALCAQCMATLATVKRETNSWKWALFMFSYMTVLAYLAAVGINQLGMALGSG